MRLDFNRNIGCIETLFPCAISSSLFNRNIGCIETKERLRPRTAPRWPSTETLDVLKRASPLIRCQNFSLQPKHWMYWNKKTQSNKNVEKTLQPKHWMYWNRYWTACAPCRGLLQPKHWMYWNLAPPDLSFSPLKLQPKHWMYWNKARAARSTYLNPSTETLDVLKLEKQWDFAWYLHLQPKHWMYWNYFGQNRFPSWLWLQPKHWMYWNGLPMSKISCSSPASTETMDVLKQTRGAPKANRRFTSTETLDVLKPDLAKKLKEKNETSTETLDVLKLTNREDMHQ